MNSNISWMIKTPESNWFNSAMLPKSLGSNNEVEPWEPLPNMSWSKNPKSSESVNSVAATGNSSYENVFASCQAQREKLIQTKHSHDLPVHQQHFLQTGSDRYKLQSLEIFNQRRTCEPSERISYEKKNNSDFMLATNSVSQSPNMLSNLLSCLSLDQNHSINQWQADSSNDCFTMQESLNALNNAAKFPQQENRQYPNSYCNTLSPSSSSDASPKEHTDLVSLMEELAYIKGDFNSSRSSLQSLPTPFQSPPSTPSTSPTKGCVFCKNNGYHSTFYKSHVLKNERGQCRCPVLRTYVCPLCQESGDSAHTLKYCPRNTVTRGDPISAGLPPGKVTNWREVATKMANHHQ